MPNPRGTKRAHRNDPRFLSSVARGMSMIECLADAVGPRSLTELAQDTGLPIPTLQRLTTTLVDAGYVEKSPKSKRYRLTVQTLDLLYYFLSRDAFAKSAWPHMVRLRESVQHNVSLSLPLDQTMIFLHRLPGHRGSYESTLPGRRSPMHAAASGHCALAAKTNRQIETYLDETRNTSGTSLDQEALYALVQTCRRRGYGLVAENAPLGFISLACPVLHDGRFVASVSVHAPRTVTTAESLIKTALPAVSIAATSLSS